MTTYTSSLRMILPDSGALVNTWGTVLNASLINLIDSSIAGYTSITMSDADYTLSTANGSGDQARSAFLNFTGTNTAIRNVLAPAVSKEYVVSNNTTGGFSIVIKISGGAGVTVPNGQTMKVWSDGTNFYESVRYLGAPYIGTLNVTGNTSLSGTLSVSGTTTIGGALSVSSGGISATGGVSIPTGNLSVTNSATVGGSLSAAGISSSGTITVPTGNITVSSGSITVSGSGSFGGGLGVTGAITGSSASFSGNGSFGNTLSVGGNTTITGSFSANSGITSSGTITISSGNLNVSSGGVSVSGSTTIGGTLGVSNVSTFNATVNLSQASGTFRYIQYQTSGSNRWGIGTDSTAESGGNAGSNFYINRQTDSGSTIDTVLGINRATGLVNIGNSLSVATNATVGGTLGVTGAATFSSSVTASSLGGAALSTAAQTLAGSSTTQAITPAGFAGSSSIGSSGYYKFPGGLIIAWGSVSSSAAGTVTLTLPTTFTNSSSYTITLSQNNSAGGGAFGSVASGTKTATTAGIDGWGSGGGRVAVIFDYQIIGF